MLSLQNLQNSLLTSTLSQRHTHTHTYIDNEIPFSSPQPNKSIELGETNERKKSLHDNR